MKNKLKLLMVLAMVAAGAAACGQNGQTDAEEKPKQEKPVSEDEDQKQEEESGEQNQSTENQNIEDAGTQKCEMTVYFSNADASGFESEKVEVAKLSTETVWEQLVEKGVVPMDVRVLGCTESEKDGGKALDLDLSEKFSTYLSGQGSAGEYVTVGSICNTFLDAFASDTIRITVNGKKLETGHAEYPGYMSKYE